MVSAAVASAEVVLVPMLVLVVLSHRDGRVLGEENVPESIGEHAAPSKDKYDEEKQSQHAYTADSDH